MKRSTYTKLRKRVRENGRAALRWMKGAERATMERVLQQRQAQDELAEREGIVCYCSARGLECNVRHTASRSLLARFEAKKNSLITIEIR